MTQMQAPSSTVRSDDELLAEFADKGSETSFAEVVRRHGGMVLAVCRSVLGSSAEAEDAAQAVFLTLAKKAGNTGVRTHVAAWLHRVAWYVAARARQAGAIRRRHEREAARMKAEHESEKAAMEWDGLHRELERLPEKYRTVLILHHLEGHSQEEVGRAVGCSAAAVAVRMHRGREMLRQRLDRRGEAALGLAGAWGMGAKLPAMFAAATAKAAAGFAAGGSATGASAEAVMLAKSALGMLWWAQVKLVTAAAALVMVVGGTAALAVAIQGGGKSPAVIAATRPVSTAPARTLTGVIVRVDPGSLALQQRTGAPLLVAVDKQTVVTLDDVAASWADVKPSMTAACIVENGKAAREVRAYSPGVLPKR